jgi:hypothetical protein
LDTGELYDKTAAVILGHSGQSKQECSLYVAFISFAAGHYLGSKLVKIGLFLGKNGGIETAI